MACHKVSQCNSKFNCRECNKKHHTSLCHVFTTNIVPSWEEPPPDQTLTTTTSMSLSVSYMSVCLLKIATQILQLTYPHIKWKADPSDCAYCTKIIAPIWNSIFTYLNKLSHLKGLLLAEPVTSDTGEFSN